MSKDTALPQGSELIDVLGTVAVPRVVEDEDNYPFLQSSRRTAADTALADLATQLWNPEQSRLFLAAAAIIEEARLARLAYRGSDRLSGHSPHEVAIINLHISRLSEKFRRLLSECSWNVVLVPWLNAAIFDNIDRDLLREYIDILRNLRVKCPELVEAHGLLDARGSRRLAGNTTLKAAIMRPLDPPATPIANNWSFPEPPIMVLAPGEYSWNSNHLKGWKEQFTLLGKVVYGPESAASARDTKSLAKNFMKKVQETKQKWPRRPIILIGFSVGPQMQGMAGNLADAVDTRDLIKLKPPTLFAIGSQSRLCPVALMEQVRLQMVARNKLVIVRDADENLRISLSKRLKIKLTQSMTDQQVIHQIGNFIQYALSKQSPREESIGTAADTQPIKLKISLGAKRPAADNQDADAPPSKKGTN